jgi:hypothetical protein
MTNSGLFMAHWVDIDPERMESYETMYQWSEAAEAFYAPAGIGKGQVVADFGCGPGHAAIEFARRAGFAEVALRVLTKPDTDGRLLGMIRTVIGYARKSGTLDPARIDTVLRTVERGLAEGSYLAVPPQFLVTATA